MSLAAISTLLVVSFLAASSPAAIADDAQTVYEALAGFNFPIGILPKGVTGYELDSSTGQFHAYLNGSCSFALEGSYQLKYKSSISGYISQNKLTKLSGISVKVLFLWLNIVEVVRNQDELDFSVGIASASFPIDNFYVCPQCGCGLDCNHVRCLQESEHGRTPSAGVQSRLMSMRVYYGRDKFLHFAPCLTREKPNGDLVFGNDV